MADKSLKTCFVIAPIGEPDTDTRKRSDQILKYVIAPAVNACGYDDPVRADGIDEPGIITNQVIQHILDDDLVIADLTDRNPNVFYELAIRHAVRKPFVQIVNEGEAIPFDVAATRTIFVNHQDLERADQATKEISDQIKSLERGDVKVDTPVSVTLDLQLLQQSGIPEQRDIADVLSEISGTRSVITEALERNLTSQSHDSARIQEALDRIRYESRRARSPRRTSSRETMMVLDNIRLGYRGGNGVVFFPVVISLLRDQITWLYDIGMELDKQYKAGNREEVGALGGAMLRLMDWYAEGNELTRETQEIFEDVRQSVSRMRRGEG